MSKPITHLHKWIERKDRTINTTECRRVSNASADYNVTDKAEEVTCKLCLKAMAVKAAQS